MAHDGDMTEHTARRNHRNRAWALPTAAALAVAGGIGYASIADASSGLEAKSAQEILTGMQQAKTPELSGTVVATADLGLPDLPGMDDSAELTSLVSGSHTMRVWYGGPDRMRLAKLGDASETNVIRNGKDAWIWSSAEKKAVHYSLPNADSMHSQPADAKMPKTPQEASEMILDSVGESSTVSTNAMARVAGRDAYELVLTPKQDNTLVKNVRLAVDGETMIPLRMQVFSRKLAEPAYEIGYSSLSLGKVEDRMFTFTAPTGTTVKEADTSKMHDEHAAGRAGHMKDKRADAKPAHVAGEGWSRVYVMQVPKDAATSMGSQADEKSAEGPKGRHGYDEGQDPAQIIASLPKTSGSWGTGRVLEGTLFSIILTDDGRLAMGAVDSGALGAGLAKSNGQ